MGAKGGEWGGSPISRWVGKLRGGIVVIVIYQGSCAPVVLSADLLAWNPGL